MFPFLACIVLVFIHTIFGAAVVKRGIIFVDLALAQWAALGYLVGSYFHIEHSVFLFLIAFAFSSFAGGILSLLKPLFLIVNLQEAIIGIVYILGSTVGITLIAVCGMEGHHLSEMLAGHLLFINQYEVLFTFISYIFCGLGLYFIQRQCSNSSFLYDFCFYCLFSLVVTSSVKMVGILLVFSFLVIPVLTAQLFYSQYQSRLYFSWFIGSIASLLGLVFLFSLIFLLVIVLLLF